MVTGVGLQMNSAHKSVIFSLLGLGNNSYITGDIRLIIITNRKDGQNYKTNAILIINRVFSMSCLSMREQTTPKPIFYGFLESNVKVSLSVSVYVSRC